MDKEELLQTIKTDIRSIQKNFSNSYIESLTEEELLANCHPLYREEYEKQLKKLNNQE